MSGQSRVRASNARPPATQAAESVTTNLAPDVPLQRLATTSGPGSRRALLALQGAAGNRAVQRLVNDASALEEPAATASPDLFNVPDAHLPAPGGGQPIPDQVRRGMEGALGQDFSDVRVHTDSSPDSVGALAYTQGTDVHFRPGMYQPDSQSGREALGHELAHVVQQRAGRVATPQGMGAPVNADPALEAEADAIGKQAARAMESGAALAEPAPAPTGTIEAPAQRIAAPVQRLTKEEELAAVAQQQIATQNIAMFEAMMGGGKQGGTETSGGDSDTAPTATDMTGGEQALAEVVPETDSDTGAPEGSEEAIDKLGKDSEPLAAMLAQMAEEVGPDNVLATLQADFDADQEEDADGDASGMTSVPTTPQAIESQLGVESVSVSLPSTSTTTTTTTDTSPQTETMTDDEWLEMDMFDTGRGRSSRLEAPEPTRGRSSAIDEGDEWSLDSMPTRGRSSSIDQGQSGLNLKGGDSTTGDVGLGFLGSSIASKATSVSSTEAQSLFGGSLTAAKDTSNISGGLGEGLGTVSSLLDAGQSASRATVLSGDAMVEEGGSTLSSLSSATSSTANTVSKFASSAASTAGTVSAGASVATGSVDMIRGMHGMYASRQRQKGLSELAENSSNEDVRNTAKGASESQRQRVTDNAVTTGKGALSVAGGAILLALGLSNPVGLGLLAGAALVGGAYALYKYWRKKKSKNKDIGGGQKAEGEAKAELAATLYTRGIVRGESEYQQILIKLGFDADKVMKGKAGGVAQSDILSRVS